MVLRVYERYVRYHLVDLTFFSENIGKIFTGYYTAMTLLGEFGPVFEDFTQLAINLTETFKCPSRVIGHSYGNLLADYFFNVIHDAVRSLFTTRPASTLSGKRGPSTHIQSKMYSINYSIFYDNLLLQLEPGCHMERPVAVIWN